MAEAEIPKDIGAVRTLNSYTKIAYKCPTGFGRLRFQPEVARSERSEQGEWGEGTYYGTFLEDSNDGVALPWLVSYFTVSSVHNAQSTAYAC